MNICVPEYLDLHINTIDWPHRKGIFKVILFIIHENAHIWLQLVRFTVIYFILPYYKLNNFLFRIPVSMEVYLGKQNCYSPDWSAGA